MTTLREAAQRALEVLLKSHTCPLLPDDCEEATTALRAALAQQAEPVEPVAEVFVRRDGVSFAFWLKAPPPERTKLYTTPQPQRKPLTDEDILRVLMLDPPNPSLWPHLKGEAIVGDVQQAVLAIVRAVERALEEKNRGR